MKLLTLAALVVFSPLDVFGQTFGAQGTPKVTVVAGVGNAMGWLGAQAEGYLKSGRISVFGGVGYTPEYEVGRPSGVTVAAGTRGFTSGRKHRAFFEVSVSQIVTESFTSGTATLPGSRVYGPGLQGGYQYVSSRGLTGLASIGVGFPVGAESGTHAVFMAGFGLGYTWRR